MLDNSSTPFKIWFPRLSVIVGVILALPAAYVAQEEIFVLRRADVIRALEPLAVISLAKIQAESRISREISVPSDRSWSRLTKRFGNPKFLIAAVNVPIGADGHDRRVYRSDEVAINLKVLRVGSPVNLESTMDAPYGYSSESASKGLLFAASPGEHLSLAAESLTSGQPPPGDLVVVADWPRGDIVDALDAFSIVDTLRWLLLTSCAIGVALIAYGVRGSRRGLKASH